MLTYFVLTLYCLTCQPVKVLTIENIPAFTGGSTVWANLECRELGDILSGDWDRRNLNILNPKRQATAQQELIVYTCTQESGPI